MTWPLTGAVNLTLFIRAPTSGWDSLGSNWPFRPQGWRFRHGRNCDGLDAGSERILFYSTPFKPGKVFLLIRIIFHSQAARRSLRSSVLRRSMARPCCYWKKTISWAPWTSNWGLHWKSSPASVCSKIRSLFFFLGLNTPKTSALISFHIPLWLWIQGTSDGSSEPQELKDRLFLTAFWDVRREWCTDWLA